LLRARMLAWKRDKALARRKWVHDFLRENARLRRYLLRELERNGPLLSRDLKEDVPADAERHAWWGRGALRLMLDILAGRGEIARSTCGTSTIASRCTCRRRSASTATTCCHCSSATGSSAASSRASTARRAPSRSSARGVTRRVSTRRSMTSGASSEPSESCV